MVTSECENINMSTSDPHTYHTWYIKVYHRCVVPRVYAPEHLLVVYASQNSSGSIEHQAKEN